MKRNADFRNALGQPDDIFRQSVIDTLTELNHQAEKETRPARRFPLRAACAFAAALVLAAGLTVLFSLAVSLIMNRPLRKISMVESLKSVD